MRNGEDYTEKNCVGYAYNVLLLGLSKCGGKRFGKQLRGGPRIDGLNNTNKNIINMDRKEVDSENEGEMQLCHVFVSNGVMCLCVLFKDAVNLYDCVASLIDD